MNNIKIINTISRLLILIFILSLVLKSRIFILGSGEYKVKGESLDIIILYKIFKV